MNRFLKILIAGFLILPLSCKKYLDAKSDASLSTISMVSEVRALLDYYGYMNSTYPAGGEVYSDNYYLNFASWSSQSQRDRDQYLWIKDPENTSDWLNAYTGIYTCNLSLEALKRISIPNRDLQEARYLEGTAHFFRGYLFYGLAQYFCVGYNTSTADQSLGIPLRLETRMSESLTRGTLNETYAQILSDLKNAVNSLPESVTIKTRPIKAAAYGALARAYLSMQDYKLASVYADSCLQTHDALMDFNDLDPNAQIPIQQFNEEILFHGISGGSLLLRNTIARVDSNLYKSYAENDLRKLIFFTKNADGSVTFKGDYDNTTASQGGRIVSGIITDEMYLIKAECEARTENNEEAHQYLNELLRHRYLNTDFVPVSEPDNKKLLRLILDERRKELIYRGSRLSDLKRLNQDLEFQTTLYRKLQDDVFSLPPGDDRYQAQIPISSVLYGQIEQNP